MTLDLTLEQINIIMSALGNAPYIQVAPVIAEIQKQAQSQLPGAQDPVSSEP